MLVIPPERMAHVTGTMIASLIALEGAGAAIFGAAANSLGSRRPTYWQEPPRWQPA